MVIWMNRKFILVVGIVLLMVSMIYQSGMLNVISSAQTGVNVSVNPGSLNVAPYDIFNISISIANAQDVARWMLSLQWNASVLELFPASSQALTEGSFMSKNGTTFFHPPLNQGPGMISAVSCDFRPPSRANGDGILFNVSFRAIGQGITEIAVYDCVLTSSSMVRTIPITNKGRISVSQLAHYVKVSLDPIGYVFANEKTVLVASVTNLGTEDENNFNMRILINNNVANSSHLDRLNTSSSYELPYEWTPLVPGSYTIIGDVESLPNQTRIENASAMVTVESETHALSVSLDCPAQAYVNQTVLLNTTVTNQGALYETSVNLTMAIRGANKTDNVHLTILMPNKGSNSSNNTSWKFSNAGTYAINVIIDERINNSSIFANATIVVLEQSKKTDILIVSDTGGVYSSHGTSLKEFTSAMAGIRYDVWFENYRSVNGSVLTAGTLQAYNLVIWTCGDYTNYVIDPYEEKLLLDYVQMGGDVLLEGESIVVSLVALSHYQLMQDMLNVKYEEPQLVTTGIEPTNLQLKHQHMIVQGLDFGTTWAIAPTWGPNGVKATDKGFAVMNYTGTEYAAVTVVDGSEVGKGSVVYYSFSLFSLPEAYRNKLFQNTLAWFERFGISTVTSQVLHASAGSVSFIYGGSMEETGSDFNVVAGSMLYVLCKNEQVQLFADTIDASRLNNSLACLFGNLSIEVFQEYNASGVLPITIWQNGSNPYHYLLKESHGNRVFEFHNNPGKNSTFIIQSFTDQERNTTGLAVWGADPKGMWAAGVYLSMIVARQLRDYAGKYYIFSWIDANGDSTPQQEEIREVPFG
jgi:hypothetical protein